MAELQTTIRQLDSLEQCASLDDLSGHTAGQLLHDARQAHALREELEAAKCENAIYRERFGCLACGEDHPESSICPPHEVRTTGQAWSNERLRLLNVLLTQTQQQRDSAEADTDALRKQVRTAQDAAVEAIAEVSEFRRQNEAMRTRLLSAAGDDLCRLSQEEIKELSSGGVKIPPKEEFLASCERFHEQIAAGPGVLTNCLTLAQLIAENERLTQQAAAARSEAEGLKSIAVKLAAFCCRVHGRDEDVAEDVRKEAIRLAHEYKAQEREAHAPSRPLAANAEGGTNA